MEDNYKIITKTIATCFTIIAMSIGSAHNCLHNNEDDLEESLFPKIEKYEEQKEDTTNILEDITFKAIEAAAESAQEILLPISVNNENSIDQ